MNKQEFILLLTQSHVPTSEEYEKYRKEGLKRNLENFNVNDEYVTKKIKRFVEFHEKFSKDEVKDEIINRPMFRTFFIKDPIRANMYEEFFEKTTKEIPGIDNFRKPEEALYLCEGKMLTKKEIQKQGVDPETKSMDFVCDFKEYCIWFYNKYAKEPGGHQDNQYDDLKRFVLGANKVQIDKTIFVGVADGEYFNSMDGKSGKSRINTLRDLGNGKTSFGIQSTELESILNQISSL